MRLPGREPAESQERRYGSSAYNFTAGAGDEMMSVKDRSYFLDRAAQEDKAALAATSLKARWVHEELAMLYRTRACLGSTLYPVDEQERVIGLAAAGSRNAA